MEFHKISSIGPSTASMNATLLPETTRNRFQRLNFAKHFERERLWNAIEQRTPPYLNTAQKVLLTIPLLLIQKITETIQAICNSGISFGSCLFSKRAVVVITPPAIDKLSTEDEPILDDSKKDVSQIEIVISPELNYLKDVKIAFSNIVEPSRRLTYAASMGYLEGVKIALDSLETNINYQSYMSRNDFGSTALMEAALGGHKEIVELLLKAGADPNIIDPSKMSNCDLSIVGRIFKNGDTALMKATLGKNRINNAGNKEIVELLLNAKADPNIQDFRGNTALILAAEYGKTETVELLLNKGANPNIKTFTKNMVTFRSQNDWTALMEAARKGHNEIVRLLLDAKADPNIQSEDNDTALILATNTDQPDIVRLLLKAKADPNIQNKAGDTALILAAFLGREDIVKLLIDAGADLNIQNKAGGTALMWAAEKRHKNVVKQLLDAGADADIKDNDGRTVLSRLRFAYQADDIVQLIRSFDHSFKSF